MQSQPFLKGMGMSLPVSVRVLDWAWGLPGFGALLLRSGYRVARRPRSRGPVVLTRPGAGAIPDRPEEIRLFCHCRNQVGLLPSFLSHYRRLGVGRFFVVDNDSTDDTVAFLLHQPEVHLFQTPEPMVESNSGMDWIHALLRQYGLGHWALAPDIDEFFIYPQWESLRLPDLIRFMESEGATALYGLLLDMYSDRSLCQVGFKMGEDPLRVFPFFDRASHVLRSHGRPRYSDAPDLVAGTRARVFGEPDVCLNKIPLFKFHGRCSLGTGHHHIVGARLSRLRGAVLHFKYGPWLLQRLQDPVERAQFDVMSPEHLSYASKLAESPDLTLVYDGSERYQGSDQLVRLHIMETSPEFEAFVAGHIDRAFIGIDEH